MNKNQIIQELCKSVNRIKKIEDRKISESEDFIENLGFRSLDIIQLVASIEEKFGLKFGFEEQDIAALNTFGSLVSWISTRIKPDSEI